MGHAISAARHSITATPCSAGCSANFHSSLASSFWFGAIIGPLIAFVIVLLLSIAFSLTLGPTLDQNSSNVASSLAGTANAGQPGQDTSSSTVNISLYSNPLLLLASANQSKMVENITEGLAGDGSQAGVPQVAVTGAVSSTAPTTLLLIIPAIGLIIGGYLAASTDYTERRRFSIIRGASICILYALLTLIASLFASGSLAAKKHDRWYYRRPQRNDYRRRGLRVFQCAALGSRIWRVRRLSARLGFSPDAP